MWVHSIRNETVNTVTKKFLAKSSIAHTSGVLIIDQNRNTDVFSIGKISGVKAILKTTSGIADPILSDNAISVSIIGWGSAILITNEEYSVT